MGLEVSSLWSRESNECTASSSSLINYLKGSTDPEGKISPEVNVTGMKQMSRNIQNIYIFGHVHLGMFI